MRNMILAGLLIGTVGYLNAEASSARGGNEVTVVMTEVEGAKEGALTVKADKVRFDLLATTILDALSKHDGKKLSYSFDDSVAKQVVSLHMEKQRARTAILRGLMKCGQCEIRSSNENGVEHATFIPKQDKKKRPPEKKVPTRRRVTPEDKDFKMMEATLRSFLGHLNEVNIDAAKSLVRLESAPADPTHNWSDSFYRRAVASKKVELDKLVVRKCIVQDGDLKKGKLSVHIAREGVEKLETRNPRFLFIDGKCYLTGY
jgi:hypothetical protein